MSLEVVKEQNGNNLIMVTFGDGSLNLGNVRIQPDQNDSTEHIGLNIGISNESRNIGDAIPVDTQSFNNVCLVFKNKESFDVFKEFVNDIDNYFLSKS
ncbi:hypothetical protein ACLOAU_14580 [Niabella sp. CJ426]|uniref:hypothetical protein n=1 Tax=Niabella sp. CJ426 TaxID=3393740 RepID=UPI003D050C2A